MSKKLSQSAKVSISKTWVLKNGTNVFATSAKGSHVKDN